MAKRSTKENVQQLERAWYTVGWSYPTPLRGAVGGSIEVYAQGEAEAQALAEAKCRRKGETWESIRIVKGRDPGPLRHYDQRHDKELGVLLGTSNLHFIASSEPSPIWATPESMPDPDATPRDWWMKFMNETSHGLSVSDYPNFLFVGIEDYHMLALPHEAVNDIRKWEGITSAIRLKLDWWKADIQEYLERKGKAKNLSAEDAELLKWNKARLKDLKVYDAWTYKGYAEKLVSGGKPNPMDLENPRLYRLSNGKLIPITNLGPNLLRVNFWKRLLILWDGPADNRADHLRAFLDHHHRNGGKPEQFRDLVEDTLPRLHKLAGRELLADKLEGWLQLAVQYPAEGMPTDAELGQLEGMRWVLVRCVRKPTAPWWKEHHMVKVGEIGMEDMGAVKACPACYQFIPTTSEEARGIVERMVGKNPGLRLSPLDGSEAHPLDVRNTYRTFNDGRLFAEVNGSSGAGHFLGRLRHEASQLTTRATNVDALLDHHLSGPNPVAFVEFIRGEVLTWKSGRGPSPNSLKGWLALNGKLSDNALTVDPWQVDRCERWLDRVEATLNKDEDEKVPPEWITFDELLGVDAMKKVRQAIKDLGVTYVENKGKSRCIASLHAACDHFGREPKRNGHWPQMLGEFFGGYFSPNATKVHRSQWIDTYRVAYAAMKDKLEE